MYLKISDGEHFGWGEAAFPPYVTENPATFKRFSETVKLPNSLNSVQELQAYLNDVLNRFPNDIFGICALDIALHNLLAAKNQTTIKALYNLPKTNKLTSITIGICDKKTMEQKIADADFASCFKLKVNQEESLRIINDFTDLCKKPFVIDANQGFTDREKAKDLSDLLFESGVNYLEQPFDKNDFESHKWLTQQSKIPIIADESFQRFSDLEKISESFNGINVKLMKSGGLSEAKKSLESAKLLGMTTMLGCMSESSIAVNAAWELASLADYIDLDGPFLINNDPFKVGHSELYNIVLQNKS